MSVSPNLVMMQLASIPMAAMLVFPPVSSLKIENSVFTPFY